MKLLRLALLLILPLSSMAAQPIVQVEGARFRQLKIAIPMAVVTSTADDSLAQILTTTVRKDLELCGVFAVLNPKSYLGDRKKNGTNRANIIESNWQMIGAEGLVKMQLKIDDGSIFAEIGIHQIGAGTKSVNISTHAKITQVSYLAHKIAADIYKFFTNSDGIFMTKIAAAKVSGKNKQIVLMDFDGNNQRAVTNGEKLSILPTISPNGQELFFTEYTRNPNLVSVNLNTGSKQTISSRPGLNMGASVSPANGILALTLSNKGSSQIYFLDRKNSDLKQMTTGYGINTSASWSPDGKQLAFVSSRSGNPHLYTMNADGSEQTRRTFQGKYNQTPRWSPTGDYIAFTARDEEKRFDIFLLDTKNWKISRVTQGQGDNEDPNFSPDGKMLVFSSTRTGKREIFLSTIDGVNQKQLTSGGDYSTPVFGKGI